MAELVWLFTTRSRNRERRLLAVVAAWMKRPLAGPAGGQDGAIENLGATQRPSAEHEAETARDSPGRAKWSEPIEERGTDRSSEAIDGEVKDAGNACRTWWQPDAGLDAGDRSIEREYVHRGADGWYVVFRDAERDDAGRRGPLATTTEVEDPLDTIALNRVPGGRFAKLETDGGAQSLFDFVRENLTARLVAAARWCTEGHRAEASAAAGGDDRTAGPDPIPPRRWRWPAARHRKRCPGLRRVAAGDRGLPDLERELAETDKQNEDRMVGRGSRHASARQ